jgi:enterochelin esterase-like enzyme
MVRDYLSKMIWLAPALALVFGATAGGQGRGGGASRSTVENVVVHGKALETNRQGDSADRNVTVYLPPGYASDNARQFPVIYFLHDYGEKSDGLITAIKAAADKLAALQGYSETIVVIPDANTTQQADMYSSSANAADWERFIAEDLVSYIDMHYRVLSKPISRGIAGHLMGGYGALRIGMKRPDVFSSVYAMSACCLTSASSSMDALLDQYVQNPRKQYGIAIDAGTNDPGLADDRRLHDALVRLRIAHYYDEFEGTHSSRLSERLERNVLPFFSRNLAAPANPTSPGVQ